MVKIELRRKTAHVLLGLFIVTLIVKGWASWWVFALMLLVAVLIAWKGLRDRLPWYDKYMGLFDRKSGRGGRAGVGGVWFVLGAWVVWLVFGENPAHVAAAIMVLTFGDTAASIVGSRFGEIPNPLNRRKLIEGTVAGIIFGFAGAAFFVPMPAAFVGALVAMIVEAMEFRYGLHKVDDNFLLPIIAAVAMYPLL